MYSVSSEIELLKDIFAPDELQITQQYACTEIKYLFTAESQLTIKLSIQFLIASHSQISISVHNWHKSDQKFSLKILQKIQNNLQQHMEQLDDLNNTPIFDCITHLQQNNQIIKETHSMKQQQVIRDDQQKHNTESEEITAQPIHQDQDTSVGIVVINGKELYIGSLCGRHKTHLYSHKIKLPKRHKKGGQSAPRFGRIRG
eukprot:209591_1